jgi:fructose-1,6-bisphosphatase/inositol monophosphatase family enzyme
MPIDVERIVKAALRTIWETQLTIQKRVEKSPTWAFTQLPLKKPLLNIDSLAEGFAGMRLMELLELSEDELYYLGEEILGVTEKAERIDLTNEHRLVVLVDMVDGTDLLERGLSNWCSAMVFFDPQAEAGKKIVAAFVGIPQDGIYYAVRGDQQAWKHRFHVRSGRKRLIALPPITSSVVDLTNASICFYGQQIGNLAWLGEADQEFLGYVWTLKKQKSPLRLATRIYNIAGMPMMMNMLDCGNGHRRMDAVFDVCGQQPHDMVAGAFIAQAANAVLSNLDGDGPLDLERSLLQPANNKLWYILAATDGLSKELRQCLRAVRSPDV